MKLTISLLVPGMSFNGDSLNKHSLGGSETAGLCLARELAAQGHRVYMFCNTQSPGDYDGVTYLQAEQYTSFVTTISHDVTIVQRMPQVLSGKVAAKLKYLWCHDLAQGRNAADFNGVLWNVDKVVVVSEWMKKQYMEAYHLEADKIVVLRNGIDMGAIPYALPKDRDTNKLIYTSRPERGLDVLLAKVFPEILKRKPEAKLYIAGYNNQVEHLRPFYSYVEQLAQQLGDRVVWLGHLTKKELYEHYTTARALVYPTPSTSINQTFAEVSCITALECMACGLPFVASTRGALSETCGPDNFLVEGEPKDEGFVERMVDEVCRVMDDDQYFISKTVAARNHLRDVGYDWSEVAKGWTSSIMDRFIEVNNNSATLVQHFINTSDIEVANELLDGYADMHPRLSQVINENWDFTNSTASFREQYAKIGNTHTDIYIGSSQEPRLKQIIQWLSQHPEIKSLVDFGCGLGVYAIEISNAFPEMKVTGIDISDRSIEMAQEYIDRYAKYPQNLTFKVGDHTTSKPDCFDCALAAEVVEHVSSPWAFIQQVESLVKEGGWVFITVPYGPWEQLSYETYPYRAHLWNFEYQDIHDMLGKKPKLNVQSHYYGSNGELGLPLGHNLISYRVDHRPIGEIDLERKIQVQNPAQTVSVNILAGPNCEETLHWCLRSVMPIANEIIIGDAGMSPVAKEIIAQYQPNYRLQRVEIIPVPQPTEVGFDHCRNEILKHATMDWVLWIDTDEKLLEPHKLIKYLQTNGYNGYGIRQHHFAVDTSFNPDMPVRLFRRDAGLSFYGRCHEHPEIALNQGPGPVIVISDVHIAHVGYLIESGRRGRFWRNNPLIKKDLEDYPDRLLQKHFLIRDNMLMVSYIVQQNGGQVNDEIIRLCKETVALYREHFLGKMGYVNVDSQQYVSQALKILGEGFDARIHIELERDGHKETVKLPDVRYANYDEMIKDLSWQLNVGKRFEEQWW